MANPADKSLKKLPVNIEKAPDAERPKPFHKADKTACPYSSDFYSSGFPLSADSVFSAAGLEFSG